MNKKGLMNSKRNNIKSLHNTSRYTIICKQGHDA